MAQTHAAPFPQKCKNLKLDERVIWGNRFRPPDQRWRNVFGSQSVGGRLIASSSDICFGKVSEGCFSQSARISLAELCQLNNIACEHFARLLFLAAEMRRRPAGVQGSPSILKGVA
jgi:hypothetical protein